MQQQSSDGRFSGTRMLQLDGVISSDQAEAASPISSRPPAGTINFDELALTDHDDHHQTGGGSSSSGNRWPRQEALALLKIRSEMDVAFRDSTLKGPLWDEVSRKLGELGYVRSAKKCKEKFENVHKYYKRTKEGRAGRQDGKTYRFFNQLEAMHGQQPLITTGSGSSSHQYQQVVMTSGIQTTVATASVGNVQFGVPSGGGGGGGGVQPFTMYSASGVGSAAVPVGISFSSESESSDSDDEVEDDMMSEEEGDIDQTPSSSNPKRKRSESGSLKAGKGGNKRSRMMDFFEGLMKQVMQKQEAMQQKFLETIEKREQDRLIREEAWKQHEAARLAREQQLAAQERAMAASRDAAIVSFIHKITGQTIQLPQPQPHPQPVFTMTSTAAHHVFPVTQPPAMPASAVPQQSSQQKLNQPQITNQMRPPAIVSTSNNEVIMAVPERQIPPQSVIHESNTSEPASSSRWPKAEVLALIKLRSNLENRYQEAGPKGPLWEEISLGMQKMGYNRSSKRCKEKWENINKYFKKVKESNKKRPEDAKTCPYFNELDALYQRKNLGSSSMVPIQQLQQTEYKGLSVDNESTVHESVAENAAQSDDPVKPNDGGLSDNNPIGAGQGSNIEGSKKPEDIMMEPKQLNLEEYNQQKIDELVENSADDEDDEDESEQDKRTRYKIDEFQRPQTNNKNGGTSSSSFSITMVQ